MENWLLSERELMIEIKARFSDVVDNLNRARTSLKHAQEETVYAIYPYEEGTRERWSDRVWNRHEDIINNLDSSIENINEIGELLRRFKIQHEENAPEQLSWFE